MSLYRAVPEIVPVGLGQVQWLPIAPAYAQTPTLVKQTVDWDTPCGLSLELVDVDGHSREINSAEAPRARKLAIVSGVHSAAIAAKADINQRQKAA